MIMQIEIASIKPRMLVDIDNVVLQTNAHMSLIKGIQMETEDGLDLVPFKKELRMKYLQNPEYINDIPLCESVLFAFPILSHFFELHTVSARWEFQRKFWEDKFDRHGLLKELSGLHLRADDDSRSQEKYKTDKARELEVKYAAEDYGPLIVAFSSDLEGVVVPDRAWNGMMCGPNIFRCKELIDFALALIEAGSPRDLFASRRDFLANGENMANVYVADKLPPGLTIAVASGSGNIRIAPVPHLVA